MTWMQSPFVPADRTVLRLVELLKKGLCGCWLVSPLRLSQQFFAADICTRDIFKAQVLLTRLMLTALHLDVPGPGPCFNVCYCSSVAWLTVEFKYNVAIFNVIGFTCAAAAAAEMNQNVCFKKVLLWSL